MKTIWMFGMACSIAAIAMVVDGCGNSSPPPMCGSGDSCQATDLPCTRSCGQGETRLCECGTGTMAGTWVCGECANSSTGGRMGGSGGEDGTGGRAGRGTGGGQASGGATASGGRQGRGTGGAATGGAAATGGRAGRGTGGEVGTGGRAGRGTGGGPTGTGGSQSSDAGSAACPADAESGGSACTATATPVCRTACVNSMYNICTCSGGNWVCPANQIACP